MPLTRRNISFIDRYLVHGNATRAAEEAGYTGERTTLSNTASGILAREDVKAEIASRTRASAMEADEVLRHLAEIARGEYSRFIEVDESGRVVSVNVGAMAANDRMRLVKKIRPTRYGQAFEFEDRLRALELIGKHLRMWTENVDLTSGGAPIQVIEAIQPVVRDADERDE